MKLTRRGFIGAGAAAVSGTVMAGEEMYRALSTPEGAAPKGGKPSGLLLAFEGLCAFVTDEKYTKMDAALLNTAGLGMPEHQYHYPTLSIERGAIVSLAGVKPVASDVDNAHFSLDGKRVRFSPRDGQEAGSKEAPPALAVHHEPIEPPCPGPRDDGDPKKWANFNWALDFRTELDSTAALLQDWRQRTDAVSTLVELRHGMVEGPTVAGIPNLPGAGEISQWYLPHSKTTRALKEVLRAIIEARYVHVEISALSSPKGEPGRIVIDCKTDVRATLSQLPVPYLDQSHNMGDLRAYWLLTSNAKRAAKMSKSELPSLSEKETPCTVDATKTCGCCPIGRFVEDGWNGRG